MQKAGKWSAAGLSKIQTWRRPQICWKPPRLQHHFYHGLGFYMIYDPSNHFFCLVYYYLSTVYNKEAGYNMPLYVQIVVFSKYWPLFNVYIHIVLLYTAANWQMSSWEDFLELQTRILMFGIMPTSILLKYMPCLLSYSCQNCQYILEVFSCTSMVRIKSVPDSQSSLCTPNHQPCDVIFNLHQPQLDDLEGPF